MIPKLEITPSIAPSNTTSLLNIGDSSLVFLAVLFREYGSVDPSLMLTALHRSVPVPMATALQLFIHHIMVQGDGEAAR